MITIQLTLTLIAIGILHIVRDRLDYDYKHTVFARLPDYLQKWTNPEISWTNKKSNYWLWQVIKSNILVDFTDLKHFLRMLQIFCFLYLIWGGIYLHEWLYSYVIIAAGVWIGKFNWFGKIK